MVSSSRDLSGEGVASINLRPPQIGLAAKLVAANYLLGWALFPLSWHYYSRFMSVTDLLISQAFAAALSIWLFFNIYSGRNWARLLFVVVWLLGAAALLTPTSLAVIKAAPAVARASTVLGIAVNLTVLWLLFVSPGRTWFKNRNSMRVA